MHARPRTGEADALPYTDLLGNPRRPTPASRTLGATGFVQACLAIEDALHHETSGAGVSLLFDRAAAELDESLRQGGIWMAEAKAPD